MKWSFFSDPITFWPISCFILRVWSSDLIYINFGTYLTYPTANPLKPQEFLIANNNIMAAKYAQNLNFLKKYLGNLVEIYRESSTLVGLH